MSNRNDKLRWNKNFIWKFWQKAEVRTFDINGIQEFVVFWFLVFSALFIFKMTIYLLWGYWLPIAVLVFLSGTFLGLVSHDRFTSLINFGVGLIGAWFFDVLLKGVI